MHCAVVLSGCCTPQAMPAITTEKIRGFSLIEFFIYETCLLSFGLWLGTCFSKFFKKFRAIIFAAFAATWLYLLWRVFFDEDED